MVWFSKHLAVAAVVALGYGVAAPGIAVAAAGAGPSWVIQSTPSPGGRHGSILLGVSCPSARACTAVGAIAPFAGYTGTIAEHWNGKKWAAQPAPRVKAGALYGVSCLSARDCIAVGYGAKGALAERWNGRKWMIQPTQTPSGTKYAIFQAVSCTSPRACTAVGSYGKKGYTLAERWNGKKWVLQSTPNPVTGTDGNELLGVSCSSVTSCTAVGESDITDSKSDTIAEHWNGRKWALQPTPRHPDGNESELAGVSCPSANACIAVGFSGNSVRPWVTLAERWNGRKWVLLPTPNPSGSDGSELAGVSCLSVTACTTAGDYYNKSDTDLTLAEGLTGTKWALQPTPNPSPASAGGANALLGVSCSSAAACTAVGVYLYRGEPTLAERYS